MAIHMLSSDMIASVARHGDAPMACAMSQACRTWRIAIDVGGDDLWRVMTLKRWPWRSTLAPLASSWKALYKYAHKRVVQPTTRNELTAVEIKAEYEFFLECSTGDTRDASSTPLIADFYTPDQFCAFTSCEGGVPLRIVGNSFEVHVRRRSDGLVASVVKMIRVGGHPDDFNFERDFERVHPDEGWTGENLRVQPWDSIATWAYDDEINQGGDTGSHSHDRIAFQRLRVEMMAHFETGADVDNAEHAGVGATWPSVSVDLGWFGYESDIPFTTVQLSKVLQHKLCWSF